MMRRFLLFSLLLGGLCIARGQTGKVRYWYDEDVANLKVTGMMNGSFEIDGVDQLSVGLHKVTTLLSIEKDTTTSAMTCLFYIPDRTIEFCTELYYWFDDDIENRQVTSTSGLITVSAESLSEGLHSIHFAAVGAHPSSVMSYLFYIPDRTIEFCTELYYWFDDDIENRQVTSTSGLITVSAESLSEGLHSIHFAAVGAHPSSVMSYLFYVNNQKPIEDYTLRFWADEDVANAMDFIVLDKGKLELDVNFLTAGDHLLYGMLLDADGNPMSILFEGMEIPDQASRISYADASQKDVIYYSLGGKRLNVPQKGLNIIRTADGNFKKVVVR